MYELIAILKNDTELRKLLGSTAGDDRIYPFSTTDYKDCIIYSFDCVSDDAIKEGYRLEITAVSSSISKSLDIINRVKQIIVTLGASQLTKNILTVGQNGGGNIENLVGTQKWYHFKAFFDVTIRK